MLANKVWLQSMRIRLSQHTVTLLLVPCRHHDRQGLPGSDEAPWLCRAAGVAWQQQSAQSAGRHWGMPGSRKGVAGEEDAWPHGRQAAHAVLRLRLQGAPLQGASNSCKCDATQSTGVQHAPSKDTPCPAPCVASCVGNALPAWIQMRCCVHCWSSTCLQL